MNPRPASKAEGNLESGRPLESAARGATRVTRGRPSLPQIAREHAPAAPAYGALVLMLIWAAHDGGYDADTWYWGALVVLALLVAVGRAGTARPLRRSTTTALVAFGLYVLWSYASIAWAAYPGEALTGSNRALLYLLVLAAFAQVPWRARQALGVLGVYTISIGAIAAVLLVRMATQDGSAVLFDEGRLISPTGYFNSNAALFMAGALLAVALSIRKELPALVRGLFAAVACGGLELAILAQSRGWLFTLPVALVAAVAISRDRLRLALAGVLAMLGALAAAPALLDVYRATAGAHPSAGALVSAAGRAGRIGLLLCAGVLVVGTGLARLDSRSRRPPLGTVWRRAIGTLAASIAVAAAVVGAMAATHGDPIRFVKNQWHGFTHPAASTGSASSHFADIGTGRYDAWRVSIKALLAHPLGGLGQDNFADYYIRHRHTGLELTSTHSLEMRMLAHTGIVGTILFAVFLTAGLTAAMTVRTRGEPLAAAVCGLALLPLLVWLIHGSVDWFWEIPALSGPALGFLAVAGGLGTPSMAPSRRRLARGRVFWSARLAAGLVALAATVAVLGFPYLSVREVSIASDLRQSDPAHALSDLTTAADLNPLSADPGRLGGTIGLQVGRYREAERRFVQATKREPGGWYGWLGAGLAASALGAIAQAHRDFETAASINSLQPAVREALARVASRHPLTPAEAFRLLMLVH